MARALECPACGARHRLDSLPDGPTFRCTQCGQVLKIPGFVSSAPGAPPPPARTGAPPQRAATPLQPNEPTRETPAAAPAAAAAAVTATAATATAAQPASTTAAPPRRQSAAAGTTPAPVDAGDAELANGNGSRSSRRGRAPVAAAPVAARAARPKRSRAHWYWRLLAWIVAVPVAFVVTAWPAYTFGFVSKDDLLDVFVGTGTGRYLRIGIVTLIWALVTAVLVQIFVEGGRAWANKRKRTRTAPA